MNSTTVTIEVEEQKQEVKKSIWETLFGIFSSKVVGPFLMGMASGFASFTWAFIRGARKAVKI
jgi:hypothetical protein